MIGVSLSNFTDSLIHAGMSSGIRVVTGLSSVITAGKPLSIYTGFLNWGRRVYELLGLGWLAGAPGLAHWLGELVSVTEGLLLRALSAVVVGSFRSWRVSLEGCFMLSSAGSSWLSGVTLAFWLQLVDDSSLR